MLWVGIRRRLLTSTSQELNSWIWYVASVGGGITKQFHDPPTTTMAWPSKSYIENA